MRNTLPPEVRAQIDITLQPLVDTFQAAVAEMRAAGAGDEQVETLLDAALWACPGPIDPRATAYFVAKLRAAVGLPTGNDC